MKEYWVNVYADLGSKQYVGDCAAETRKISIELANETEVKLGTYCLYRIHVKMDGGYNKHKLYVQSYGRAKRYLDRPKLITDSKFDWMA